MKHLGWVSRELIDLGYSVSSDGRLLDNRDGFMTDNPDDFIRTYDCRTRATYNPETHVVITREMWHQILEE